MSNNLQKLIQRGEPDRESLMAFYHKYSPNSSTEPTQVFFDRYFDTPDFQLASQNIWLRLRDGDWTLKLNRFGFPDIDDYNEICQTLSEELKVGPQKEPLNYCSTLVAVFRTFRDTLTGLRATEFTPNQFYISGCAKDVLPIRVAWCLFNNTEMVKALDLPITDIPLVMNKPCWVVVPGDKDDIEDDFYCGKDGDDYYSNDENDDDTRGEKWIVNMMKEEWKQDYVHPSNSNDDDGL